MLTYPLEVRNKYDQIRGRGRVLGQIHVLFPCFSVKTTHPIKQYVDVLTERKNYVVAKVIRKGNIAELRTPCLNHTYNQLMFTDDAPDEHILRYLDKYSGWKSSQLPYIQQSLQYIKSRTEINTELYKWEYTYLPQIEVDKELHYEILEKELLEAGITCDYTVEFIKHKQKLGYCQLIKRSGWLALPTVINFGLCVDSLYVTLHEVAHAIVSQRYRSNNHSPVFLLEYARLLSKYMDIDAISSLQDHGLLQGLKHGYSQA